MQVTVSEKMKEWVAGYIRSHRKEGTISIHVVYSKFNEDFRATFNADPQVAIRLMEASGFLKGCPSKGGYSIWLTEDAGKGKSRPYRSRTPRVNGATANAATKTKSALPIEQNQETGETEMKKAQKKPYPIGTVNPETGKSDDLIATARAAVNYLATLCEQDEAGRFIGSFHIEKSLKEAGFDKSTAHFMLFLNFMGLARRYTVKGNKSGESPHRYLVLDPTFFDLLVIPDTVDAVLRQMTDRKERQEECISLKRQLEDLRPASTETSTASFEDEAIRALSKAEQFAKKLEQHQELIADLQKERDQLQAELDERPSSVEAAKQALADRLAALDKV